MEERDTSLFKMTRILFLISVFPLACLNRFPFIYQFGSDMIVFTSSQGNQIQQNNDILVLKEMLLVNRHVVNEMN